MFINYGFALQLCAAKVCLQLSPFLFFLGMPRVAKYVSLHCVLKDPDFFWASVMATNHKNAHHYVGAGRSKSQGLCGKYCSLLFTTPHFFKLNLGL